MLIELNQATRKRVICEEGYRLAREWTPDGKHIWPDDASEKKNCLVLVPSDPLYAEEWFITSTRAITIGRELPGGNMGERYGIVCAEDDRGRSQFVLGGGKVQPDYDGTSDDRLRQGEDRELVRGAVVAENREELHVVFAPEDRGAYNHYFLFGVRGITDRVLNAQTGRTETSLKKEEGLSVGDACYIAVTHELLGNFDGQKGETRTRHVRRVNELLCQLSLEERERNVLPMLPFAQATALAMAIVVLDEIFGRNLPPAIEEVVNEGRETAKRFASRSSYARYFTKVLQEGPWEI
ncbi:MAG: hypothetical protein A2942_04800 [Candidatus Lloydbacteria bacterium RIFCSPLOWO2_01_FULL_50_20]|uniref:Uncharacterized protein n=1 Tax=Candidatus Lloydbacteria bacterium RIFCSPLOWO2_01_FULL_50_20 TaxID=1798665 RepID=A0A1G2DGI0_9BACT|nr:MAG: hypothetical protein A3C13_01070 [Candidatus Lloydbacteria bacterium RIFCSPHIGHO2_02_FULL_50_11]OGZ12767.1 MAG: hypothetical protein A2942_04800 [Candidatus Lloydbacteria bacterium RIFCSPLOWO2_01_FULL_50_20]